jgi:RNA polymerase primary sigma factor
MSSPFFSKHLSEIGNIPLLAPEREVDLGRIVQIGLRTEATEPQKRASEEAQGELIHRNLKLVVSVANRFYGCGLTLEEMTFDGNQGLTEAAKRFDSTYATFWIQQAIRQGIQHSAASLPPGKSNTQSL